MGYEEIRDKADEMNSMLIFTSSFVQQDFVEALSLKGLHQVENLALVISAINYLFKDINEKTIIEGLKKVENPYRFEYFEDKNLIVDACHNPNGAKALRENLDYYYPNEKRRFIFGCLKNKDYKKMMNILFREGDEIYIDDLIDMNVNGEGKLGKVVDVYNYGASDVVEIKWEDGKTETVPFTEDFIQEIDKNNNV